MITPDTVKSKLKYYSQKEGRIFQEVLTMFAIERLLYRVSRSKYKDNFVLKGGTLLYAIFGSDFPRSTSDIDFLGKDIENNLENMKLVFQEIFLIQDDDAIIYDLNSIEVSAINEFKIDKGMNVSGIAWLDRTRITIRIDIGFGDSIFPHANRMEFPTLLDFSVPIMNVYSKETMIAEKFHAIVTLGKANSRLKDFYDLYILQKSFNFSGKVLKEALIETFSKRQSTFANILAFEDSFAEDITRNRQWNGFMKSNGGKNQRR